MSNHASVARERIEAILDANSFVEIGAEITARNTDFNLSLKKAPTDGVVTGYGQIDGRLVYVYSQDPEILGGTMGEMHAKKIVNVYKLALKTGAPVIGLIDSGGMRLEEATDGLFSFGEIYRMMADASGVILQLTAICGKCGGGMALIPQMSDFCLADKDKAEIFVNSPDAIKGNHKDKENNASVDFQSGEAGSIDFAGSSEEVAAAMRTLVSILPQNNEDIMDIGDAMDDPNRSSEDLALYAKTPADLLREIADDHLLFETKKDYGPDMLTALMKLNGCTVGVLANRNRTSGKNGAPSAATPKLSARGASKAARFVRFLDAFSIPVISFVNVEGFQAAICQERRLAGKAAELAYAFSEASSPKISVITEKAFGTAALIMNSKSTGADMVLAWKGARIGMMDADEAAKLLADPTDYDAIQKTAAAYDEIQNSEKSAAQRGYVDSVIDPAETRKYLIGTLDMLFTKREVRFDKKHGAM